VRNAIRANPLTAGPWQRHDLLRVAPDAWASALAARPALAVVPLLTNWILRDWPVIVRRRMGGDDPALLPVGVPLPPAAGKQRVALTIAEEAVISRSKPVSLRAAACAADCAWEPTISRLIALGARHGVDPATFGSLMWQHLTGLEYLSAQSDLDVLWPVSVNCDLISLLAGIADAERDAPLRIDGEMVFPDGSAVNWRELHNALGRGPPAEVLAKTMDGVRLVNVAQVTGSGVAA
jgi:phosphoribosyl-dephospho-CoA transferase